MQSHFHRVHVLGVHPIPYGTGKQPLWTFFLIGLVNKVALCMWHVRRTYMYVLRFVHCTLCTAYKYNGRYGHYYEINSAGEITASRTSRGCLRLFLCLCTRMHIIYELESNEWLAKFRYVYVIKMKHVPGTYNFLPPGDLIMLWFWHWSILCCDAIGDLQPYLTNSLYKLKNNLYIPYNFLFLRLIHRQFLIFAC